MSEDQWCGGLRRGGGGLCCCEPGAPLILVFIVCAGDPAAALRLSSQLISLGADVSLRSRWTNMNALHYAAYFDVPELIRVLLKATKPRGTLSHTNHIMDHTS